MRKAARRPLGSGSVIFLLWWVCFFNYADRQAISSVLPLLAREFSFDPVQLGLIGSAFAWVYAALAPAAGVVADRAVRQRVLVWACVVWSLFTLATAWCVSPLRSRLGILIYRVCTRYICFLSLVDLLFS